MHLNPIVHFDWSVDPSKRWFTTALQTAPNTYEITKSAPAPDSSRIFNDKPSFSGFDVPIGIPVLYARKCNVTSFTALLPQLGQGDWADFYTPATTPSQISLTRPFYPASPGAARKIQLSQALGLADPADLFRLCDHATANRTKACELFWTLGANQVGKAAISVWRDVLAPARRANKIAIWPFDGPLATLLNGSKTVVAEVYPGEIYSHLGIPNRFGKTNPEARAAQAPSILTWCRSNHVTIPQFLKKTIQNGCSSEDQFDSLIGLLGMIEAIANPAEAPNIPAVQTVEGWILSSAPPARQP